VNQTIEHIFKNHDTVLCNLGTILPTKESLQIGENQFIKNELRAKNLENTLSSKFQKKIECGETRFYDGVNKYAIVSRRSFDTLWFVKKDGEWHSEKK
jgi:hypothetical protein